MSRKLFKIFIQPVFPHRENARIVKDFSEIPKPLEIPLLGHWHLFKLGYYDSLRYQNVLREWHKKYGPIMCEKIGWKKPVIHVFNIKDILNVYKNEDKSPDVFPLNDFLKIYRNKAEIFAGLGQTNGDEWYRVKTAIKDVMLKATSARTYFQCVNEVTDDLIEQIKFERNNKNVISNMKDLIGRWNIEVGSKIVLDRRLNCLSGPNQELARKIIHTSSEVFKLSAELKFALPLYNCVKTPKLIEIMKKENNMHEIILPFIKETITNIKEKSKVGIDDFKFLRTLLNQPNITEEEMAIVASTLIIDSLSTTNPVLYFNLYALAINQEIQEKAYEEINNIPIDEILDPDIFEKLPYLKAVIKETFRMYPNGTEIARINKKSLVLSNYFIPVGSHLSLNMFVNFRSNEIFPQPDKFLPERWIRNSKFYSASNSFLLSPFGYGARTCAGRRFATQDLLISLLKIIKNFRIIYSDSEPLDVVFHTLLFPRTNIPIRFISRT